MSVYYCYPMQASFGLFGHLLKGLNPDPALKGKEQSEQRSSGARVNVKLPWMKPKDKTLWVWGDMKFFHHLRFPCPFLLLPVTLLLHLLTVSSFTGNGAVP